MGTNCENSKWENEMDRKIGAEGIEIEFTNQTNISRTWSRNKTNAPRD